MTWPNNNTGLPAGIPRALASSVIPVGIPSSGTVGDNGALTLTTALARTISDGAYFYFPAGALFAGSAAGLYWTVMSSTTAGVVYNNTYSSGDPAVPATLTPIAATGPGAYTQTTAEVFLRQTLVAAGTLGVNGMLRNTFKFTFPSSAGNKTLSVKLAGIALYSRVRTTSVLENSMLTLMNRGRLDRQVELTAMGSNGVPYTTAAASGGVTSHSLNLSVDQIFAHTGQLAAATDYIISEGSLLEVAR